MLKFNFIKCTILALRGFRLLWKIPKLSMIAVQFFNSNRSSHELTSVIYNLLQFTFHFAVPIAMLKFRITTTGVTCIETKLRHSVSLFCIQRQEALLNWDPLKVLNQHLAPIKRLRIQKPTTVPVLAFYCFLAWAWLAKAKGHSCHTKKSTLAKTFTEKKRVKVRSTPATTLQEKTVKITMYLGLDIIIKLVYNNFW